MNLDLTRQWITHWEGKRPLAYDDATGETITPGLTLKGTPTIGVGTNLLTASAKRAIASLGLDYNHVLTGALSLDESQIDYLITIGVNDALTSIRSLCPTFNYFPENQQIVLTDLAFNLGESKLAQFMRMLFYVRNQKWVSAAAELQNSAWFNQVGRRGYADVRVLGGTAEPQEFLAA